MKGKKIIIPEEAYELGLHEFIDYLVSSIIKCKEGDSISVEMQLIRDEMNKYVAKQDELQAMKE